MALLKTDPKLKTSQPNQFNVVSCALFHSQLGHQGWGCPWEATPCGKWLGDSKSSRLHLENLAAISDVLGNTHNALLIFQHPQYVSCFMKTARNEHICCYPNMTHLGSKISSEHILASLMSTSSGNESVKKDFSPLPTPTTPRASRNTEGRLSTAWPSTGCARSVNRG